MRLRLKELRNSKRLTQEGLAMKINVSQSAVSAYEVGERTPDLETLITIAKFFNVSIDYLVGLTNIKQSITKSDLSPEEINHLHIYRQLLTTDKEKVNAYINGLQGK